MVCIDELGYMELDKRRAELLFSCVDRAGGQNLGGNRLQRVVLRLDQDVHRPRLFAAIVDRLTIGGNIIENGTQLFRLAHGKATLAVR